MRKNLLFIVLIFITNLTFSQTTLNEGFESWPPSGWEIYLEGLSTRGWRQDFESISHTGNHSAYSNIANGQMNNWLVSPAIEIVNADYELKYWEINGANDLSYYDKSAIYISKGSANPSDGDFVEVYEANTLNTADWEQRTINLSAYNGQTIYVAFRHIGTFHKWYIDDVSVAPSNFTDAALVQFNSPTAVSETIGVSPVEVQLQNLGTTVINDLTITWEVNSVTQTAYNGTALDLQPGESTSITLGNFDFNAEGSYEIITQLNLTDDFDASNNNLNSTFEVSSFKDGGIVAISPGGMIPSPTTLDVLVAVKNFGENTINTAEIEWSVNGSSQTPFTSSGLNIAPGQTKTVNIGQYAFTSGLNDLAFTLNALGDINSNNDQYQQKIPVDEFWESFEGPSFPPEGWSINFGVRDDINFDTPVDGTHYYASQPAENYFGVVTDTLYTPLLDIKNGDRFKFYLKTTPAQAANHSLVWKNGTTGQVNFITDIDNTQGLNNWEQRNIDISSAAGVNFIGIVSTSSDNGLSKFDLFTSDAKLHQFNNDLKVVNGEMHFLAKQNTSQSFPVQIKNLGKNNISGSDYTIKLMEAPNTELASASGVDINSLQELIINVNHTFSTISNKRLYFKIEYVNDENITNNSFREATVSVVPNTIQINTIGELKQYLFLPFSPGGSTDTLGEDDISEAMYYNSEFNTSGGYAYGMAYKYDNLLLSENVKKYPLKVWITQTGKTNLQKGWTANEELVLVFDGVVEILPGFGKDLYIPFNQPVLLNGIENVVVRSYQYDPEWPPSIMRFIGSNEERGEVRGLGALEVFDLDPDNPPTAFSQTKNFNHTRFIIDPVTSNTTLSGTVYDIATNTPISGATVAFEGSSITAETDTNGNYTLPALTSGSYNLVISADGYLNESATVDFNTASQTQNFFLTILPEITVSGTVYGNNSPSTPLEFVEVSLVKNDETVETISTNNLGEFLFPLVYGGSEYEVTVFLYGYDEFKTTITANDNNIDLGDIILNEEFISPFDVQVDENDGSTLSWKSPKSSSKTVLKYDFDVESNGYSNEPNEEVWLGNYFLNSELTTITSVEIKTSIYEGVEDYVTVDIIDLKTNEVLASSEPFLISQNKTQVIDVPNIVVSSDFIAAVHWKNNAETTNFLSVDYSKTDIFDGAVILYPGQNPALLSTIINVSSSFLLRVNTLDEGSPITNNQDVTYNVYRGLASEFPDTSNWDLLNTTPLSDLSLVDVSLSNVDTNENYRYAVESLYNNGKSEVTFSNEISGQKILDVEELEALSSQVLLYPNPVRNSIHIKLEDNLTVENSIEIFDTLGKQIMTVDITKKIINGNISINTESLGSGIYFLKMKVNNVGINKKFVKK